MASALVFEDDESRWLVGARGHPNQAAESLVTDPRLVPDVDVEPGVAGDNTDPIRELFWRLFRRGGIDQVTCQIDGVADNLGAEKALFELAKLFHGPAVADDQAQFFEGVSTSLAFP